jgi:hypothetical protein
MQQLHHVSNLINKWVCWAKGIERVDMNTRAVRAIADKQRSPP